MKNNISNVPQATPTDDDVILFAQGNDGERVWKRATRAQLCPVDDALSDESENPVQNKVVKAFLDTKANVSTIYTKTEVDLALSEKTDDLDFTGHVEDNGNPHSVTAEQVGAYTKAQVNTALAAKAGSSDVQAHTAAVNNPHAVTAAQVGAYTKAQVDSALSAKANSIHTHTAARAITTRPARHI